MPNVTRPPVKTPDPLPDPGTVPYFRWIRGELDAAARRRGLDPEPWAA